MSAEPGKSPAVARLDRTKFIDDRSMGELLRLIIARGASARFKASGSSMYPFIKDGDVIVVSPVAEVSLRQGHVVAYLHPEGGKLCVHRIIGKRMGTFLIRGDNMLVADGWIPTKNIIALVSRVERSGNKVYFGNGPERKLIAAVWHLTVTRHLRNLTARVVGIVRDGQLT